MTRLQPGLRVANAPHFHNARTWADRLRLNSGVAIGADRVVPLEDWRPPSPDELPLLTAADGDPAAALALFSIPDHLHARWWSLAATEPDSAEAGQAAFQAFAREILDFLHFKQLPLPPACVLEVVLQAPGQPSTRPQTGGLTAELPRPGVLGGINLGDEESAVVFLNLGAAQLAAPGGLGPNRLGELARTFWTGCSDYPVTRLALAPGEGFWLPHGPLVMDGDTRGRTDVDVLLQLCQ
jgi:hypothetical protein